MKIAYISNNEIQSVLSWSGTIKNIYDSLNSLDEIDITPVSVYSKKIEIIFKLFYLFHPLFGFTKDSSRNKLHNKIIGWKLSKELKKGDFDIVLSPGSLEVANLKTNIPTIIWTDAVFKSLRDSYPQYSRLTKRQVQSGDFLEEKALKKATKIIFAASWVVKDTVEYYHINRNKIRIIPFGANLNSINTKEVNNLIEKRQKSDVVNLLFIGADWQKKGGELLLEIFNELAELNNNYRLHIVGSKPETIQQNSSINFYGFLNKSIPKEKEIFENLFKSSHYFILPTKAEAFGIVFCEANAFGIPTIGSDLGGIKDVIREKKNGIRIDINKSPKFLARQINNYISEGKYEQKAQDARNEFDERLNWKVSINKLIDEMKS